MGICHQPFFPCDHLFLRSCLPSSRNTSSSPRPSFLEPRSRNVSVLQPTLPTVCLSSELRIFSFRRTPSFRSWGIDLLAVVRLFAQEGRAPLPTRFPIALRNAARYRLSLRRTRRYFGRRVHANVSFKLSSSVPAASSSPLLARLPRQDGLARRGRRRREPETVARRRQPRGCLRATSKEDPRRHEARRLELPIRHDPRLKGPRPPPPRPCPPSSTPRARPSSPPSSCRNSTYTTCFASGYANKAAFPWMSPSTFCS